METQDQIQAAKLEQLMRDIREGLESGEATAWNPEEIKQAGREHRAARLATSKANNENNKAIP